MKRTLEELRTHYLQAKEEVFQQSIARSRIVEGEQYQLLAKQLQLIAQQQTDLTKDIPDSSVIIKEIEEEMIEIFRDQKLSQFLDFKAKFRNKNKINNARLIGTLDLDTFITLSEVSQAKLKDYAESYKGQPIYKEIMDCVECVGRDLVGIERVFPND